MNLASKRVVAEGDSWFDYPWWLMTGGGVVSHLERLAGISIKNLANAGDESRFMLSLKQRDKLEKELKTADVLLFSGGGNDIAGDQFCVWLDDNKGQGYYNAVDESRLKAALDFTMAMYDDLSMIRDEINPNCLIVTHGYDFPIPSNDGVLWLGPWLKPSLDYCGWKDSTAQFNIARQVLIALNDRLIGWKAKNHLHINTQGTLGKDDWQNEIHPNRKGFDKIARKFLSALDTL